MNGKYEIGEIVMKNWAIRRKLGEGSFSRVYEIERKDFGETYYAALKVITIPQGEAELGDGQKAISMASGWICILWES